MSALNYCAMTPERIGRRYRQTTQSNLAGDEKDGWCRPRLAHMCLPMWGEIGRSPPKKHRDTTTQSDRLCIAQEFLMNIIQI